MNSRSVRAAHRLLGADAVGLVPLVGLPLAAKEAKGTVPADGESYLAGIFTSDFTMKERTYNPALGEAGRGDGAGTGRRRKGATAWHLTIPGGRDSPAGASS